jgi:hypothetical protein
MFVSSSVYETSFNPELKLLVSPWIILSSRNSGPGHSLVCLNTCPLNPARNVVSKLLPTLPTPSRFSHGSRRLIPLGWPVAIRLWPGSLYTFQGWGFSRKEPVLWWFGEPAFFYHGAIWHLSCTKQICFSVSWKLYLRPSLLLKRES